MRVCNRYGVRGSAQQVWCEGVTGMVRGGHRYGARGSQVWCEGVTGMVRGGLCNRYGVRGSMQQVWCEGVCNRYGVRGVYATGMV